MNYKELTSLDLSSNQLSVIENLKKSMNSFSFNEDESNDDSNESYVDCQYYDIDEFNKKKTKSNDHFSILNLNIHSIELHIDELRAMLSMINFTFDIICISESKIIDGILPKTDIQIEGYEPPLSTPTKSTKGGVLMYVKSGLTYIPRNDLKINRDKELETEFIELINTRGKNSIIGVVYRHPVMDEKIFVDDYL